jgi:BirA family transcriptional regulator, biotin operon repressor / biotin---[acetyl-CoA-carboxylase] ligase
VIDLKGLTLIREYIELDIIDSTNRYALDTGQPGLLIIARQQTAGRGRQSRTWFSPAGENIYMTLTLGTPDPRYPILTGVAVRTALAGVLVNEAVNIKWPNDILVQGRKVCGILCEARGGLTAIGIGVNVNQISWPDELVDSAISLKLIAGKTYGRDDIIQTVMQSLDLWFSIYQEKGFEPVRQDFLGHSLCLGESARLEDGTPCLINDLTPEGFLEVEVGGVRRIIVSGDVLLVSMR